jgi:hypothetical protein
MFWHIRSAILREPNVILMYVCYVMKAETRWKQSMDTAQMFQLITSHHTDSIHTLLPPCFHFHDIAHVHQFHQDYIGLPEDEAPNVPKHVGGGWYTNIRLFECICWSFFQNYIAVFDCSTSLAFSTIQHIMMNQNKLNKLNHQGGLDTQYPGLLLLCPNQYYTRVEYKVVATLL